MQKFFCTLSTLPGVFMTTTTVNVCFYPLDPAGNIFLGVLEQALREGDLLSYFVLEDDPNKPNNPFAMFGIKCRIIDGEARIVEMIDPEFERVLVFCLQPATQEGAAHSLRLCALWQSNQVDTTIFMEDVPIDMLTAIKSAGGRCVIISTQLEVKDGNIIIVEMNSC